MRYFYPRPPGGGRHRGRRVSDPACQYFYPRPPGGGRPRDPRTPETARAISIHALRVEGDSRIAERARAHTKFLSTPSGWRATCSALICAATIGFLSTPSGWRATFFATGMIVELIFLSTPSGWRATFGIHRFYVHKTDFYPRPPGGGRRRLQKQPHGRQHFYPRPPGGGRLPQKKPDLDNIIFLSTPSGWRATVRFDFTAARVNISIHALRVEGDRAADREYDHPSDDFYPRPPGGGRHAISEGFVLLSGFLSTPSGWRATNGYIQLYARAHRFLSTPSGWRATSGAKVAISYNGKFLSTPSGWRATRITVLEEMPEEAFLSTPSGWRATV